MRRQVALLLLVGWTVVAGSCGIDGRDDAGSPDVPGSAPTSTSTSEVTTSTSTSTTEVTTSTQPTSTSAAMTSGVTLYVSNQSFEDSPVTIKVTVDDATVVDQPFEVFNQHLWIPFPLNLAAGTHRLVAVSSTGVTHSATFETFESTTRTAILNYWYYPPTAVGSRPTPRSFDFVVQDRPLDYA